MHGRRPLANQKSRLPSRSCTNISQGVIRMGGKAACAPPSEPAAASLALQQVTKVTATAWAQTPTVMQQMPLSH